MRINEITETIHGESPHTGLPCLLVRFSGCDIKCPYCDTDHSKFYDWPIQKITNTINDSKLKSILITGGEPFIQDDLEAMLEGVSKDKRIIIETNGNALIENERLYVFGNCTIVMDVKLFDNLKYFNPINLLRLSAGDVIKFVFWDDESFKAAIDFVISYNEKVSWGIKWVFSPTQELIKMGKAPKYVSAIIDLQKEVKHQEVIFQTQLHKILGVK